MRMARLVARTAATPERCFSPRARPGGPVPEIAGTPWRIGTRGTGVESSASSAGDTSEAELAEGEPRGPGNAIRS